MIDSRMLTKTNPATGEEEAFYPYSHISSIWVNEEMTLDTYLEEIIKLAPHNHSNKSILDLITKEYTVEQDKFIEELKIKNTTTKKSTILKSSEWYGDSAPYTNIVSIENLTSSCEVSILISDSITTDEYNQFKAADIHITSAGVGEGIVTLKAFGTLPTIDLPITLVIKGIKESS